MALVYAGLQDAAAFISAALAVSAETTDTSAVSSSFSRLNLDQLDVAGDLDDRRTGAASSESESEGEPPASQPSISRRQIDRQRQLDAMMSHAAYDDSNLE
mmetsp:Transcript_62189/g.171047  ORF Transcript_62189/g.171047 Transcript_62189/m.171047 type:complete len:101 (-) Transcript_62189:379-681(-)|eukprot:CAMPEP_0119540454 /NCGR_PEP_ID=MMETSP1344-20130328/52346_1 /TAXON_ID=236787 /ORGANISM="Florenciella parvula, Strain CCMP2471" /LENGTH=100 /DNA_ID=CAMNT_0007584213 /DNA_START=83 /DNA_END=385 /DNA_ORIENTATION=+